MTKRSLECYLHAAAIAAAGGGLLEFNQNACTASVLAQSWYERVPQQTPWRELTRRARVRLLNRAKRWLNTQAVEHMTLELLNERDPAGEVIGWLTRIATMVAES